MFIRFMNNDDWVYYQMVQNFLNFDFTLDPISAPTFYSQGILAFFYSLLFGIKNLPYLTLIISFFSVVIFYILLRRFLDKSKLESLIISSFLIFNPYFAYSSIGFMTENYFLFYILLALWAFKVFEKDKSNKNLLIMYVFIFLGLMLRQVMLVFVLALFVYYLLLKKYKWSIINFIYFAALYTFYSFIFPKTSEMYEKSLQFQHLLKFDYSYSIIYGSLIVIFSLLLPLVVNFIIHNILNSYNITINQLISFKFFKNLKKTFRFSNFNLKTILNIVLFLSVSIFVYYLLNNNYKPMSLSWGEFPYLENTWERTGFYPRGIEGTKYQFIFNYDLYFYWDTFTKIFTAIFIAVFLRYFSKKYIIDFNFIFVSLYMGLMLLTETFYDRYLLIPFVFTLIFLVKHTKRNYLYNLSSVLFLLFLSFYTYNFTLDFIKINNYVWNKSNELVNEYNVDPTKIHANNAWKLNYRNNTRSYLYRFSYDSTDVNSGYKTGYTLIDTYKIDYPLNFFIDPVIYLYRQN